MTASSMIRHGSERGYREEIKRGDPCERCRKGHNMYDRLSRKARKGTAGKPDRSAPLDHLWSPAGTAPPSAGAAQRQRIPAVAANGLRGFPAAPPETDYDSTAQSGGSAVPAAPGPPLGERLSAALGKLRMPAEEPGNEYVPVDEVPDYLHESAPDPEPADPGEWSEVTDEEYVINAAGMRKIEENLGTYLSVIGMTAEMLDPYCGAILAENFENIVSKWSKVIGNYPKAAQLFLDGKSGVVFTWIGAVQATWPVLFAVYQHHLAKTIQATPDGRIFQRRQADANWNPPAYDGMTPPMPGQGTADAFNYTAN